MDYLNLSLLDELKETENINTGKITFLKGENNYAFNYEKILKYIENSNDLNVFYYKFKRNEFQTAYYPIFNVINEIYNKKFKTFMPIKKLIDKCNVYSMHKDSLYSFLKTGNCTRKEKVLLGEIDYESKRIIEDIYNILSFLSQKKPIFLIFDSFQYSNIGLIKLISKLIEQKSIPNILIFIYYNPSIHPDEYIYESFIKLINIAEKNNLVINSSEDFLDISPTNALTNNNLPFLNSYLNNEKIPLILNELNTMLQLLDIDDAYYYLNIIYNSLSENNKYSNINTDYKLLLLELMLKANLYLNYSNDLVKIKKTDFYYFNYLLKLMHNIIPNNNSIFYYKYNYYSCIVNQLQDKTENAYQNYTKCKKYGEKSNNFELTLNADIAYYLYLCYNKFLSTGRKNKVSEEEISLAKTLEREKYYNTLMYLYMYNFESDKESIQKISKGEMTFVYLEKAVDIAKKLDNRLFLKIVYGRKATYFNSHQISNMLFKKDVAIQKQYNIDLENSKFSFMAYRYTMNEEFSLSHDTNSKLILKIYNNLLKSNSEQDNDKSSNEIELLIALYNMGNNSLCAKDYESTCFYLLMVIKSLKLLNIFSLNIFDLTKIFGMIAYCYYKRNMFFKSSAMITKIKQILAFSFTEQDKLLNGTSLSARCDTLFYYYVTSTLLAINNNNLELAKKYLIEADKFFMHEEGQWPIIYPIIAELKYTFFSSLNLNQKADNELKKCIEFCTSNNLLTAKTYLEEILNTKQIPKSKLNNYFKLKCISKENIYAILRQKRLEMEVENYKKSITFISVWHNNVNSITESYPTLLNSCMEILQNYLLSKRLLYITCKDTDSSQEVNIPYNTTTLDVSLPKLNYIIEYFNTNTSSIILKRTDSPFYHSSIFFNIWDNTNIVSFLAIPTYNNKKLASIFICYTEIDSQGILNEELIDSNKLNTLKIVLNQLIDLERIYNYKNDLISAVKSANSANKAKSDFLANMSHEIRTPINTILGMNEMILRECHDKTILSYSKNVELSSNSLLALINNILDFSKIESGKMEIVNSEYSLNTLLSEVYLLLQSRAMKKDLCLKIDVNSNIPDTLYGDDIRIKQIIVNLLTNAVKYTNQGQISLIVDFENIDDDNIILKVAVKDTGIGIKKESIKDLFESFTRLELNKNRSIEGTGLGLSITQRLLCLMNSKLNVESTYGVGSTFSFEIKQKKISNTSIGKFDLEKAKANNTHDDSYTFTAPDSKILFVDDNDMNRIVFKSLLKRTKINVTTLSSGFECLKEITKSNFDIIFLDHMMPKMDGIETLKKMKVQDDNLCKNTPVIVLTANAISTAKQMYLNEGFTAYLSKPIKPYELENTIKKYLPSNLIHPVLKEDLNSENAKEDLNDINIPGINITEAMKYNPDKESFYNILNIFYNTINSKADAIASYKENGEIDNYTVEVHALKSSAKTIGATLLSNIAKEMEFAGKDKNIQLINQKTDFLLSLYKEYLTVLKPYVKNDTTNINSSEEEIPLNTLKKELNLIYKAIDDFDLDTAEKEMKEIEKYSIPKNLSEDIHLLKNYVANYNAEEILDLIPKMLKKC